MKRNAGVLNKTKPKKNSSNFLFFFIILSLGLVLVSNPTCLVSTWMLSSLDHFLGVVMSYAVTMALHLHSGLYCLCQTFLLTHHCGDQIKECSSL